MTGKRNGGNGKDRKEIVDVGWESRSFWRPWILACRL